MINFTDTPAINDTVTVGDKMWVWNGVKWAASDITSAFVSLTGNQSISGVKTFTNRSVHYGAYTPVQTIGFSTTPTFDCSLSNIFEFDTLTNSVTSLTLTNYVGGQTIQIRFVQDSTGSRTVPNPTSSKIDGSIGYSANRVSWLIITYSVAGARWEGNWMQVPA